MTIVDSKLHSWIMSIRWSLSVSKI